MPHLMLSHVTSDHQKLKQGPRYGETGTQVNFQQELKYDLTCEIFNLYLKIVFSSLSVALLKFLQQLTQMLQK